MSAAIGGCGGDDSKDEKSCKAGTETCVCRSDDSCDDGLVCLSKLCVTDPNAPPGSGGTKGSGGGHTGGTSGNAGDPGDAAGNGATSGDTAAAGSSGSSGGSVSSGGSGARGGSGGSSNGGTNGGPTPVELHGQLSVSGTHLVDSHGKPVKLEGMSSMWLNWEPTGYALDPKGLVWMRDNWDLRVFRIAMGVYSEDDTVNTYLADPKKNRDWVNTIVQNAIDAGVYVIIDWHDHIALSHQTEALAFFDDMSSHWGDTPNVLYEVFNEPLDLDWSSQLKPYHEAVVSTIRSNDPDNVIVLGTPNWDQDVDIAAQDPLSGSNLMYTLHFYACTHQAALRNRAKSAFSSGLPLFVTEWGATAADGGVDGIVCADEARAWHDWLDQANISWAAWKLDGCTDATCMFKDRTVPTSGGWDASVLNGHAPLVIEEMTNDPPPQSGTGGTGGSGGSGGTGGMGGSGGSGGSGIDLSEKPEACALVSSCPTCCVTSSVFALDAADPPNDITSTAVTAWSASGTQASASFSFTTSNEVGAIFFKFGTAQYITGLGVDATATGGTAEVALVKDNGASGCIYIDELGSWYPNGCWGTPDYTYDQIEVRVRSVGSGSATLTVNDVQYQ